MNTDERVLNTIDEIIRLRRTVKTDKMNGRQIEDEIIQELLALADWAPTHARTEPWKYFVFSGDKVKQFAQRHAELYREFTPSANFTRQKYENIEKQGDNVSHIIVACMKRVASHKIPEMEEIAAVAASIQNILLAAASRGIASFWSTGGMALHPAFKNEFDLGEEDRIIGILYLGYTDDPFKEGNRIIPLSEKIEWIK